MRDQHISTTNVHCAPITLCENNRRQDTMQGSHASFDGTICAYLALRRRSALLWPCGPHRWCDCIAVHCHSACFNARVCVDVRISQHFLTLATHRTGGLERRVVQRCSQPPATDLSQPRHGRHSANRPANKTWVCVRHRIRHTSCSVRQHNWHKLGQLYCVSFE